MNEESAESIYTFKLSYPPIDLFEKCTIPDEYLSSVDLNITKYASSSNDNKVIAEKEYFKITLDFDLKTIINYYHSEWRAQTHNVPAVAKNKDYINKVEGMPLSMSAARRTEIKNAVTAVVGEDIFSRDDAQHISLNKILTSKQIAQIIRNIIAPYEEKKTDMLPEITVWYHDVPESIAMSSGIPDLYEEYITLKDKNFKRWKIVNKSIQPDFSSTDYHDI